MKKDKIFVMLCFFVLILYLALLLKIFAVNEQEEPEPCINLYYETDEFFYNQTMTIEKFIKKLGIMQNTSRELKNASVQMMVMDCEES